jgi:hypothetical protein
MTLVVVVVTAGSIEIVELVGYTQVLPPLVVVVVVLENRLCTKQYDISFMP